MRLITTIRNSQKRIFGGAGDGKGLYATRVARAEGRTFLFTDESSLWKIVRRSECPQRTCAAPPHRF